MQIRVSSLVPVGLLAVFVWSGGAVAEDQRFQGLRQQPRYGFSHDRAEPYANSRIKPVTPTRPFFVQPYPRHPYERDTRRAYRNGYREGYGDGYSDRGDRRHHDGRYRHNNDRDAYTPGYDRHAERYRDSPYRRQIPNYYAPQPGASFYYDNGGLRGGIQPRR